MVDLVAGPDSYRDLPRMLATATDHNAQVVCFFIFSFIHLLLSVLLYVSPPCLIRAGQRAPVAGRDLRRHKPCPRKREQPVGLCVHPAWL
jgi:hypothetical protein